MADPLRGPWLPGTDESAWADVWYFEELVQPIQRGMAQSSYLDDATDRPITYEEVHPGAFRRDDRLKVLDENHTELSICFPNVCRFCGQIFLETKDKDIALLALQAYNDWMIDEWCGGEKPARLVPLTLVPLWDADLAATEVRRCAAKGSHAISFPESPPKLGLPSIFSSHWDPLLQACQETDTVINMHVGSSSSPVITAADAPVDMMIPMLFVNSQLAFSDWLYSGVLQEYTGLRIVLSEGQVGWMPFVADRLDSAWLKTTDTRTSSTGRRAKQLPSSVIAGRVFGCVFDDLQGLNVRHEIGTSQILIETDFPHTDSTYPNSQLWIGEMMEKAGLDDAEIHMITRTNAIGAYGLDRYFGIAP